MYICLVFCHIKNDGQAPMESEANCSVVVVHCGDLVVVFPSNCCCGESFLCEFQQEDMEI
jgi:hypothetical protein